jgi:hypothetical protein
VLSGSGPCDELITRPEESYRMCCVVVYDLETSRMGAPYIYDISHLRVIGFVSLRLCFSGRQLWRWWRNLRLHENKRIFCPAAEPFVILSRCLSVWVVN